MSLGGTYLYQPDGDFPDLVGSAVEAALTLGFELCCHPATGRLLSVLAGGVAPGGRIAETGTGTGVGLAWMAASADPRVEILSAEIDADRAAAAQELFADVANVTVLHADSAEIFSRGPFDLLVMDGGPGAGKDGKPRIEPRQVLTDGGCMTIDDLTPFTGWPPVFQGDEDTARTFWMDHPDLLATEIQVAPDMAVLVCRFTSGRVP